MLKTFNKWWALTNYGVPIDIFRTRKECMMYAEELTGEPWSQCRGHYETRKVMLTEGWG